MQPTVEPVRSHLTSEQVAYLIQEAPNITYGRGLEITDLDQNAIEDISDDFISGSVERSSHATLHGSCSLSISRPLDWGWQVVKPYMTLTDGVLTARFNLGAYFTNTPSRDTRESPVTYEVVGYDLLYRLNVIVGDAYGVVKNSLVLDTVEQILIQRGYTKYIIDQSRADALMPDDRVWAMDQNITWLTIVNGLLASIGYQGIWTDWNGYLRCEPYIRPVDRGSEWYLGSQEHTSILGNDAQVQFDYFEAYNRWVGVRSNNPEGETPVEGNGLYSLQNDNFGPTSIEARRGLTITRQESLDAVTQADLVTQVQRMADADMSIPTTIPVSTAPFPLVWHFDRFLVDDPDIGVPSDILGTKWVLSLDGSDMSHEWTVLNGVAT
jgi:hypothetical protein